MNVPDTKRQSFIQSFSDANLLGQFAAQEHIGRVHDYLERKGDPSEEILSFLKEIYKVCRPARYTAEDTKAAEYLEQVRALSKAAGPGYSPVKADYQHAVTEALAAVSTVLVTGPMEFIGRDSLLRMQGRLLVHLQMMH